MNRATLFFAGLIALLVGIGLLTLPRPFFASYGVELSVQASLLSEVRAPGGLIVAISLVLLRGAFSEAHLARAAWLGSLFYLSYAVARLLSIALDGLPHHNLLYAGAGELILGVACTLVFFRTSGRTRSGSFVSSAPSAQWPLG